jgi:predicted dehydrogenase
MYSITIIGAGSIGNHIAHAARARGWSVTLSDRDPEALRRARESIYPSRYGSWDEAIALRPTHDVMTQPADVVFVGTPPDTHIPLALQVLDGARPRALVLEKPLCGPDLADCEALRARAGGNGTFVGVGYNHTLGRNTLLAERLLAEGRLGEPRTLSARIREHWAGIFRAHPWLSGPADSYLGYLRRGGGSIGEHSHGINIWQHFARLAGAGRVLEVSCSLDVVRDGGVEYDRLCLIGLKTEGGLLGEVIQDVVTSPAEKCVRLQGSEGYLEWRLNVQPNVDSVAVGTGDQAAPPTLLPKTRADDFIAEIDHLAAVLEGRVADSPISLERGLETMLVIAAALKSHEQGRRVTIDWSRGCRPEALR